MTDDARRHSRHLADGDRAFLLTAGHGAVATLADGAGVMISFAALTYSRDELFRILTIVHALRPTSITTNPLTGVLVVYWS